MTYWPYGWEWILYTDWHSTSSYFFYQPHSERSSNWIISKIRQIIEEIEDKRFADVTDTCFTLPRTLMLNPASLLSRIIS